MEEDNFVVLWQRVGYEYRVGKENYGKEVFQVEVTKCLIITTTNRKISRKSYIIFYRKITLYLNNYNFLFSILFSVKNDIEYSRYSTHNNVKMHRNVLNVRYRILYKEDFFFTILIMIEILLVSFK